MTRILPSVVTFALVCFVAVSEAACMARTFDVSPCVQAHSARSGFTASHHQCLCGVPARKQGVKDQGACLNRAMHGSTAHLNMCSRSVIPCAR